MAVMHMELFSITAHVECKHATPASIHAEVVWSSLNNHC